MTSSVWGISQARDAAEWYLELEGVEVGRFDSQEIANMALEGLRRGEAEGQLARFECVRCSLGVPCN